MGGVLADGTHEAARCRHDLVGAERLAGARDAEQRDGARVRVGCDRVEAEHVLELPDGVDEFAARADDERARLAAQVLHVLARLEHDRHPLVGELDDVAAGDHRLGVPLDSGVDRELGGAQQALEREREGSADVGVRRVLLAQAQVHGAAQGLWGDAAPDLARRIAKLAA